MVILSTIFFISYVGNQRVNGEYIGNTQLDGKNFFQSVFSEDSYNATQFITSGKIDFK